MADRSLTKSDKPVTNSIVQASNPITDRNQAGLCTRRILEMTNSMKAMLLSAAVTGLLGASPLVLNAAPLTSPSASANSAVLGQAAYATGQATDKHSCKGKNDCKGKGGCKSSDNGCKGKNSCKGKGGCATDGSMHK